MSDPTEHSVQELDPVSESPIGYAQYIATVTGFAEFFPPLDETESYEAMRFMDTFDAQDRIDKPITWCESLGMNEAPFDPRSRIALIDLAIDLDKIEVVERASKEDPHNEVRRHAITRLG